MNKLYFGKSNTGGSIMSKGIAYQDLVSLVYFFNYIDDDELLEITFETIEDFTLIFKNHEMCYQVKNRILDKTLLRKYISRIQFEDGKKNILIASNKDAKITSLLDQKAQFNTLIRSCRNVEEKIRIVSEFDSLLKNAGIEYSSFSRIDISIKPCEHIEDAVKCRLYEWCNRISKDIDHNMLFEKLVTLISLDLRIKRGTLSKETLVELALKCKKNTKPNANMLQNEPRSKYSLIVEHLDRDINKFTKFKTELIQLKYSIDMQDYDSALEIADELSEYHENFVDYYLWLLFTMKEYNKLFSVCEDYIQNGVHDYLSNYYAGLSMFNMDKLVESELYLKRALEIKETYEVNYTLGIVYLSLEMNDGSLNHFRRCLEYKTDDAKVYLLMSRLVSRHQALEYLDSALDIDPKLYVAFFEKGKILRYLGIYDEAYRSLRKYLDHESDIEAYKEIALCSISLNKEDAGQYLFVWLQEELFSTKYKYMDDGKGILIIDIGYYETMILACIKENDDFIVHFGDNTIKLFNTSGQIGIGVIQDQFLKMCRDMKTRAGHNTDVEETLIPFISKIYDRKTGFDLIMQNLKNNAELILNKDYYFPIDNDTNVRRREYILREDVSVRVFEKLNHVDVEVKLGGSYLHGQFKKSGEGYFGFTSKVLKQGDKYGVDEAEIIYMCVESYDEVHIKIPIETVSISKQLVVGNYNTIG